MFYHRLKDRSDEDGDDKIFGKVTSVAVEFLCVFLIAGEIFYDLEYETNPDISDVGDALYWSFLKRRSRHDGTNRAGWIWKDLISARLWSARYSRAEKIQQTNCRQIDAANG